MKSFVFGFSNHFQMVDSNLFSLANTFASNSSISQYKFPSHPLVQLLLKMHSVSLEQCGCDFISHKTKVSEPIACWLKFQASTMLCIVAKIVIGISHHGMSLQHLRKHGSSLAKMSIFLRLDLNMEACFHTESKQ